MNKAIVFVLSLLVASTVIAPSALAFTPTLSLTASGNNLTLYVSNADPYSQVSVSYINPGTSLPTTLSNTYWQTNSSGQFTTTLDTSSYGIYNGASLYVTVSGTQSTWQSFNSSGSSSGQLSLSQTSISLSQYQSTTVTAYNNSGNLYVSSNSNSSIATTSINGNILTIYGASLGSTTIYVCGTNPVSCAYLYVTVTSGQTGQITFSNTSPSLTVGQSLTVNIYTPYIYSGTFYVASNTSSAVVDTSISGTSLYLYAKASGTSTIQVCQSSTSTCGYIYVTVTGSQNSGNVWFSPTNPTLYVGQSLAVSINSSNYSYSMPSYTNAYYISSNSNSSVVTASLNGTVLNLYASQIGTSSIIVCHSALNFCGTLQVTVSGSGSGLQGLTFSNASPNLTIGQTLGVAIYRSTSIYSSYTNYYVASNSNQTIVTASINGEQLSLYGLSSGSSTINVCQNTGSQCGSVYVTVSGMTYPSSLNQNGQLINENGTIYIVYKNTRTPFTNASAFQGFGFKFENATSNQTWNLSISGRVINTANDSHPWGSWIVDNGTVYFVHETGLIPIPSWDTFLNNGGQSQLIVQANTRDMQRPQLGLMVYSDTRLR